ncbi:MAG: beta-lactamase family protein, partial [Thermomicrobiales bacterium]|nr:beta-lactamase family protein [Thermomicrobiales bacterium]
MNRSSSDRPARLPGRGLTRRAALAQAGLAAAGAAIAGVAPGRAAAQEATPAAPGESTLSSVTPERAALATARIPELARDMLERSGVPGMAVAVVYDDAVTFSDGFGVRELGKDAPIDVDTVFQLASVSKSLASTVVASVVGDGTISWTSRMADVAPGFSLHDAWPTQQVSLADLFSHRSGLRDHAGDLLEDLGFERAEILHRLRYLEPA